MFIIIIIELTLLRLLRVWGATWCRAVCQQQAMARGTLEGQRPRHVSLLSVADRSRRQAQTLARHASMHPCPSCAALPCHSPGDPPIYTSSWLRLVYILWPFVRVPRWMVLWLSHCRFCTNDIGAAGNNISFASPWRTPGVSIAAQSASVPYSPKSPRSAPHRPPCMPHRPAPHRPPPCMTHRPAPLERPWLSSCSRAPARAPGPITRKKWNPRGSARGSGVTRASGTNGCITHHI